jgi:protein-S-isoprenylcysteine O-methyltransferase Ste14
MKTNTTRRHSLSHLLVLLQIVGVSLSVWPVGMVNRGPALALALCALGAASGLYALAHNRLGILGIYPELPPDAELITSGPYRWVRHPMYTSLMLMMFGIALYNLHIINLLGVLLVASAVLGKVPIEEHQLRVRFPAYRAYAVQTPRFLPFPRGSRPPPPAV